MHYPASLMQETPQEPRKCLYYNLMVCKLSGLIPDGIKSIWIMRFLLILWCIFYILLITNLVLLMRQISTGENNEEGLDVFQQCFDTLLTFILFLDYTFFLYRVYPILPDIQQVFDKMDPEIRRECEVREQNIFWVTFLTMILTAFICYAKRIIDGLPTEEIRLAVNYKHKANPSRQLPFIVWLPGSLDDTVEPFYSIFLVYNLAFLWMGTVMAFNSFGYMIMLTVHMKGYCESIARPLNELGQRVRSKRSTPTFHGEELKNPEVSPKTGDVNHIQEATERTADHKVASLEAQKENQLYRLQEIQESHSSTEVSTPEPDSTSVTDLNIVTTFIKQHHQFLHTRKRFVAAIKLSILLTNSIYNLLLTVCLIRMHSYMQAEDSNKISQSTTSIIILVQMTFAFYLSSETLDSGNDILYRALSSNQWYNAPPDVAKLLVPIMAVVQKPKRISYFGGVIDVCFGSFLTVMKFSYSLFTILKRVV